MGRTCRESGYKVAKKLLWLASCDKVLKEEGCVNSLKAFGDAMLNPIPSWKPGLRVSLALHPQNASKWLLPISLQGDAGR